MSQHFVETEGVQPQFFVFKQTFTDVVDEQDFQEFLKHLEENYTHVQDQQFLHYWEAAQNELILPQFKLLYEHNTETATEEALAEREEDQIVDAADKKVSAESTAAISATLCDAASTTDYTDECKLLWQQCGEQVCLEQYNIYAAVFYNYYLQLKASLLATVEDDSEEQQSVATLHEAQDIANELEQLKLLGLPTAFGHQASRSTKKRNKTKEQNTQIVYNLCYSDEEYDDTMSALSPSETTDHQLNDSTVDAALHVLRNAAIKKKKNKNRKLRNVPAFLREEQGMLKYWHKRFSLFSRYDDGIRLDRESWFSVTPEKIAIHIAERLACDVIIDAFCGCGGNAIQFAKTCQRVIAIDIDPVKVEMARHNASVYGVAEKIDFIVGDFLQLGEHGQLRGDVVFLSPPWGGPKYKRKEHYDIEKYLLPVGASKLVGITRRISENVAIFLPRNTHIQQVIKLAGVGKRCEVEHNYLDSRLVAITALYGEAILSKKAADESGESG